MNSAQDYASAISATPRSLLRQRLLQTAANSLAPGEVTALYLQLDAIGGADLCKAAPYYRYFTSAAQRRKAQGVQLVARPPTGLAHLYETPEIPRRDKRLYILFSGEFGQFFLPGAMVLNLLPAGPKDVIVIRAGKNDLYRAGEPPFGTTARSVAQGLAAAYATAEYRHISILGASAGGFFAVKVAEFMGAQIALSFAGVIIQDFHQLPMLAAKHVSAFDPICACHPGARLRRINVIASKNERDCLHSSRIRKSRPGLAEWHLVNSRSHDVLGRLAQRHMAGPFMRVALAENGFWIRALSLPIFVYGQFVRYTRKVFGVQRAAHKT